MEGWDSQRMIGNVKKEFEWFKFGWFKEDIDTQKYGETIVDYDDLQPIS